jgi:hypothetical protein
MPGPPSIRTASAARASTGSKTISDNTATAMSNTRFINRAGP